MTDLRNEWSLDEDIVFLNHGSFGACPKKVLARQQELRDLLEREPVRYFVRETPLLLEEARQQLANFVGASVEDLAFVPNATTAVNSVLRSYALDAGDQLLTTNHEYNACRNVLEFVAAENGAEVRVADVPFPLSSPEEVVSALLDQVTDRTRLALVDHVTSQTGLVFPMHRIARELEERGIDLLVDGAHAPGMLPLDIESLGVPYYTGNLHKWVCAPKGAAFLYVRKDRRDSVRPAVISHGANAPAGEKSRFHHEFDWIGTMDNTAIFCVPEALRYVASLVPGGWPEVMERNRALALSARDILCRRLGIDAPCPDEMIGSLAAVPIFDGSGSAYRGNYDTDPLQDHLFREHRIEAVVQWWPAPPRRVLRVSAQLYNRPEEYEILARALPTE